MNTQSLEPVLDEQGRRLDQIRLTGISATGHHGVHDFERREGQPFVADVVVHLDTRRAAASDDLAQTVDYGALARQVHAVLAGEPAALVETVAERIAATVLAHDGVRAVDVAIHKPKAPIDVPFGDVVVAIRRDRTKLPAAEPYQEPVREPTPEPYLGPAAEVALVPDDEVVEGEVELDQLDERPSAPVDVVLALGANLGPAAETLRAAVRELGALREVEVRAVSPLARTAAVGGPEQPDFLNAVVLASTTLAPRELLRACQGIENAHGRQRGTHWGPRTLDVDIIVYGSVLAVTDDLELPHPRAHQRAFVLAPWAQADPEAVLPGLGGGPVGMLADTAPDRDGIRWLALDWLNEPVPTSPEEHATSHAAPPERVPVHPAAHEPAEPPAQQAPPPTAAPPTWTPPEPPAAPATPATPAQPGTSLPMWSPPEPPASAPPAWPPWEP